MNTLLLSNHGPTINAICWAYWTLFISVISVGTMVFGVLRRVHDQSSHLRFYRSARRISFMSVIVLFLAVFALLRGYKAYDLNSKDLLRDESMPFFWSVLGLVAASNVIVFWFTRRRKKSSATER